MKAAAGGGGGGYRRRYDNKQWPMDNEVRKKQQNTKSQK